MIVLLILAVVWAAVLLPPFLRNRREGRPADSVLSFRQQLSTLERTAPGSGPTRAAGTLATGMGRSAVRKRRRDVLFGLGGSTVLTLLLGMAVGAELFWLMFGFSAVLLFTYTFLLIQIQKRTAERESKVRVLAPQVRRMQPAYELRRSAN